jgi:hypothetical protein
LFATVATAIVLGCSPEKPETSTAKPSDSTAVNGATSSIVEIPTNLKNDAYSYYGLGSPKPKVYDLTVSNPKPATTAQTITIVPKGFKDNKADFEETDSGQAMGDSTQEMSLESDGLYVESISPQTLKTPHFLQLPAKLDRGATWTSRQSVDAKGQSVDETLKFRVGEIQSVTTPAGKFQALDIVGTGTGTLQSKPATLFEESWYVKDFGMVKQVAKIESQGVTTTIVQTLRK